jgi:polyhydroxybutyrate depolymerase
MTQHQVLAALALVAFGWLSAPAAEAATNGPAHPPAKHVKKHRPHAKPVKRAPKVAKKPAPAAPLAAAKPSTDTQTPITKPGDYSFAIQHEGRTRTYRVHVPRGYTPTEPAPLVLALRPGSAQAQDADGFYGLTRESDRQGFIAVFPDAYRGAGTGTATTAGWNAGNCCGGRVDDVGFIENVVNNVFRQVSIARQRIYAAGMSDGGMMAYRLACELPHVFTAVASVAGTDNTASCTPDKPVSVLHLHARNDRRMPYDGGADPLAKAKLPSLTSAPQTAAKWAKLDGCMEAPQPVLEQSGASCEAYTYCRGQAEVRLCSTETGGHSWPGALKRRGEDTPSQAISATQTIWSFFSAH